MNLPDQMDNSPGSPGPFHAKPEPAKWICATSSRTFKSTVTFIGACPEDAGGVPRGRRHTAFCSTTASLVVFNQALKVEDRAGLGMWRVFHTVAVRQHHFLADELREFFRTDFAQAFESRDLRPGTPGYNSGSACAPCQ
jgi:hypothetical protein